MEVLFFSSPTCGPCKLLKPVIARLEALHGLQVAWIEASDKTVELFGKYGVRAVPTVILKDTKHDEVVAEFSGLKPASFVDDFLRQYGVIQ